MSQIKKKYIANRAIDGSKILLLNNEALKALDSMGEEQSVMKFNSSNALEFMSIPELSSSPVSDNQLSRKLYVDTQVSAEQSARESAVSSEQSRAEGAESGLSGRLDTLEGGQSVVGSVAKSLKDSKDYTDSAITSLIDGAPGMLDTLKEISDALQSGDGVAAALATTVASNLQESKDYTDSKFVESAGNVANDLATETLARIAQDLVEKSRAEGEEARIEGKVDQEVLDRGTAISAEQSRAQTEESRIDGRVTQEVSDRQAAISAEQSARDAGMLAEVEAREFTDASLANRLDVSDSDHIISDGRLSALESGAAAEQSRAEAAEAGLQSNINTEKGRLDAILSASNADKDSFAEIVALINSVDTESDSAFASYVLSNNEALTAEVVNRLNADNSEQSARESADSAEQSRAQAEEARIESTINTEISQRLAAVSSLDSRVTTEVSSLQASILQEQIDRESAIIGEQTARVAAISAEESARFLAINTEQFDRAMAVATEQSAREEADVALEGRLDLIEAVAYRKHRSVIDSTNLSDGFIELPMEAVSGSEQVFVGPLYIHESDEYSVSVVGGKTRIVFGVNMQSGGVTPLSVGDLMYVRYVK